MSGLGGVLESIPVVGEMLANLPGTQLLDALPGMETIDSILGGGDSGKGSTPADANHV